MGLQPLENGAEFLNKPFEPLFSGDDVSDLQDAANAVLELIEPASAGTNAEQDATALVCGAL